MEAIGLNITAPLLYSTLPSFFGLRARPLQATSRLCAIFGSNAINAPNAQQTGNTYETPRIYHGRRRMSGRMYFNAAGKPPVSLARPHHAAGHAHRNVLVQG